MRGSNYDRRRLYSTERYYIHQLRRRGSIYFHSQQLIIRHYNCRSFNPKI